MKVATIGEIAEDIVPGFACRPVEADKGVLQLRPYSITAEGKMNLSESKYVKCAPAQFEKYKLHEGDILFNNTNSPVLVGKTALFSNNVQCVFSNHLTRIRVKRNVARPGYVARFLHGLFLTKVFFTRCQQWVNQAAIPKSELGKIKIPLPDLKTQEKIDCILLSVDAALEKRREAIRLLDDFLKSTFLEMFGDPILNSKGLRTENASGLFVLSSGKFNPTKNLDDAYPYPTYGGNGITGFSKEYLIDFQTVVIGRVGAYCGCVHLTRGESWITDNAIYIKEFAQAKIDIVFLFWLFQFLNLRRFAGYSGQPKITQEPIQRLKLPLPPLSEQQRFLRTVQQTEQLGQKMKSSETELQNLFAALMQMAFKEELH